MKTSLAVYFMALMGLFITSCSSDDGMDTGSVDTQNMEGKTAVNFELDASSLGYIVQTKADQFSPSNSYTKNAFSIYAFRIKQDGGSVYEYEKTIDLTKLSYSPTTKKLTGTDILPIGNYKFLPVYGIANQSTLLTTPDWAGKTLNDTYTIGYEGGKDLTEIFLPVTVGNTGALTAYPMGLTSTPNQTVTAKLQRAVSRVDLMFIKVKKEEDGSYTETAYPENKDVFGEAEIEKIEMRYKGLNNLMSYFGSNKTTTPFDKNIELNLDKGIIMIGESENASTIGVGDTFDYDNINSEQLIYGSAHVFGNYLLPNNDASKATSLEIYIKPKDEVGRTINVSLTADKKLPLERNKVTIVKVYVIEDDPNTPPPTVFTTKVKFDVEIETKWAGSHEVTGELE